jgi:hypothetical protein
MLFTDQHKWFFRSGQWCEGHVLSQEGWDKSGASFFGSKFAHAGVCIATFHCDGPPRTFLRRRRLSADAKNGTVTRPMKRGQ